MFKEFNQKAEQRFIEPISTIEGFHQQYTGRVLFVYKIQKRIFDSINSIVFETNFLAISSRN